MSSEWVGVLSEAGTVEAKQKRPQPLEAEEKLDVAALKERDCSMKLKE